MSKPTDIRLKNVEVSTQRIEYRVPMKFGGRVVTDVTLLDVSVDVETRDGRTGRGVGSMPMGNAWAWPTQAASNDQTLQAMVQLGEAMAAAAESCAEVGHPLDITQALATGRKVAANRIVTELGIAEPMPELAQLVAASPLEAAIHDAYGVALEQNSYDVLGAQFANRDLAAYLTDEFSGEYLDRYTLRQPKPQMPLYHLVGALDPLSANGLSTPVDDGLPETLEQWIPADGLTHLKIKLSGDDLYWDVSRVVEVERVAHGAQKQRGCEQWWYSLDFNEKCAGVDYVLEFLRRLQELSPMAFARVQYIEQPTHRDLRANPENRMHAAAKIKPVVIDESLVDLESLQLAREQGYSGVALKACKGHTEALLMAAAAQKYELFLCVQDLTCVGRSFLHSASLAARIPGVAAVEGNGRQYCPAGNSGWDERFPDLFQITDGTIRTGVLTARGLGF